MLRNKSTIQSFRTIFFAYTVTILLFSAFYLMPASHRGHLKIIDSIFLSTSTLSGTGLSTIDLIKGLTWTGKTFLLAEMQFGGIGILVLISYIFMMTGKRLTMSNSLLLSRDQNQSNISTIRSLSLSVLLFSISFEISGFLLLFSQIHKEFPNIKEAVFISIFHSISSFTNGGMDLFGSRFKNFCTDPYFLLVTAALVFFGGLGYPTIMEYIFRFNKRKSLFSKINIFLHSILLVIGSILFFITEYRNELTHFSLWDKIANAIFLSANIRNAGFSTLDMHQFTSTTLLILMMFMFLGGASSSPTGGIRLTTFAVILAKMRAIAKSEMDTVIGKKKISQDAIDRSILIVISFMTMIAFSAIILTVTQKEPLEIIIFEVESAVTNTGLSLGLTPHLSVISKVVLIFLMFIGRIGIFALIYTVFNLEKTHSRYLKEDLAVG